MNFEINKEDWAAFFESLSKRRFEWMTKVEILKTDIGDQILTDGLPLNGITTETHDGRTTIDISVGESTDHHQTHSVIDPVSVAFLAADDHHGDVINIEEKDGTKTLITFIEPMGILFGFTKIEMVATA